MPPFLVSMPPFPIMAREALAEESDDELDDRRELDDADEDKGEEDYLRGGFRRVEVAKANSEEGDDGEVDALEVRPVFLLNTISSSKVARKVRRSRRGGMEHQCIENKLEMKWQ
jgi:hypothetical protein